MNQRSKRHAVVLAALLLAGCAHPPDPRTVLDIVSDECVVLRKLNEPVVDKGCASEKELEPWFRAITGAKRAAAARAAGSSAPPAQVQP